LPFHVGALSGRWYGTAGWRLPGVAVRLSPPALGMHSGFGYLVNDG
jgi:hypothetical protein